MARFLAFSLLILTFQTAVNAQNDSTLYIFGLPVSGDDTARQFVEKDMAPKTTLQIVATDKLPEDLRKVLDAEEQYTGWQDTLIYYNRNTKLFLVPVRNSETIKTYGLNENGKPVTYDEVNIPKEP